MQGCLLAAASQHPTTVCTFYIFCICICMYVDVDVYVQVQLVCIYSPYSITVCSVRLSAFLLPASSVVGGCGLEVFGVWGFGFMAQGSICVAPPTFYSIVVWRGFVLSGAWGSPGIGNARLAFRAAHMRQGGAGQPPAATKVKSNIRKQQLHARMYGTKLRTWGIAP